MIQLAKILHSRVKRFLNHCDPHVLQQIPDGLYETEKRTNNTKLLLTLINRNCESPFRDCLTKPLQSADSETGEDKQRISCLIDDFGWMFAQPIAQLPRLVVSEFTVSFFRSQFVLPKLRREVYLPPQGIELKPGGKPVSFRVNNDRKLVVTRATLGEGFGKEKSVIQYLIGGDKNSSVDLCALYPNEKESCSLSLVFERDVDFTVIGDRGILLTGYLQTTCVQDKGKDVNRGDSEAEDSVLEFPPPQKRDLWRVFGEFGEKLDPFLHVVVETTITSSGLMYMSCKELEKDSLTLSNKIFKVPIFAIGPLEALKKKERL
ncbi:hypothetical protein ARALYDRAFT_908504 [Arabidopsis lyrata subsp. lyrata]|uniref:Nucleoplasmin-like domain-containing protein n=1 Tax=Arabidopsis lyrata subsp. lyrata TaxID=81972 RepID=D7LZ17_ARALL|nr:hypothetical protein ARALYDRAFT_908504 [Arabidopsis lyrata subsp. lyrata]